MTYFTGLQERPMPALFKREDHYEDYGFAVMAEAGDHDIYVWEAMYIIQGGPGRPRSQWLGDGVVNNSMVIVAPREWRHKGMHNNHYFRTGMSLPQYHRHDALRIEESDERVVWRVGEMEYVSELTTGTHHIRGRNAGVELDLTLVQLPGTSVVPLFGSFEEGALRGMAGAYSYSDASGTVKVGGRTFDIKGGEGLHEHIGFAECAEWDVAVVGPRRDAKGGSLFGSWRAGGIAFQIHSETPDHTTVVAATPGKDVIFQGGQITLEALEQWVDPKSGVSVPCRWKLACASDEGSLEVEIAGYARGGWPWELKRAVMLETLMIATTNGRFQPAGGESVAIRDALAIMDYTRMLLCHQETLDGPDLTPTW